MTMLPDVNALITKQIELIRQGLHQPGQRDCAGTIKNAKIFFFYDLYLAENQTQCPASVLSFEQA